MTRFILLFVVCVLNGLAFSPPVPAQDSSPPPRMVQTRLVAEHLTVKGGETIWIGVEHVVAPHWHIYWRNPGDSGLTPRTQWTLPEGLQMGEVQWPVPEKIMIGPLANYGYDDKVVLLQQLTLPKTLPEGPLTLKAGVELLVCQEICVPESGTYELTLNDSLVLQEEIDQTAFFDKAKSLIPYEYALPDDPNGPIGATYSEENGDLVLRWPVPLSGTVEFFPAEWGVINNSAPQTVTRDKDTLILRQKRGDRAWTEFDETLWVIGFEKDGHRVGYSFKARKDSPAFGQSSEQPKGKGQEKILPSRITSLETLSLFQALFFALIGGVILNLMPCVFPILSMKAMSLVKMRGLEVRAARLSGLAYAFGVILSFCGVAGALLVLKMAGAQIGWGFQFQNPWIVGFLVYLLFVLGLNLMGFFDIANPFGAVGGKLTQKSGVTGAFFTGVLATVVATPCTAPFMAGAIAFALVQPALIGLLLFAVLGFGLALPYLLLCFVPALQKILPRPGHWMETFRQFLAFPMFLSALWLVWVLGQLTGENGVTAILFGVILITFAIWLSKHVVEDRFFRFLVRGLGLGVLGLAVGFIPLHSVKQGGGTGSPEALSFGTAYSDQALKTALEGDDPVFVEMTAAWCITCKINHAVALDVPSTRTVFERHHVRYLVGDWTNEDPAITQFLASYGRNGVPLYTYFAPPAKAGDVRPATQILPQVLTPALVQGYITTGDSP